MYWHDPLCAAFVSVAVVLCHESESGMEVNKCSVVEDQLHHVQVTPQPNTQPRLSFNIQACLLPERPASVIRESLRLCGQKKKSSLPPTQLLRLQQLNKHSSESICIVKRQTKTTWGTVLICCVVHVYSMCHGGSRCCM